jgi:hypothetical protein
MKHIKLFLLSGFVIFTNIIFAQTTTDWKVSGNTVGSDSKLGTNNAYDLIFETYNIERMRLTSDGKLGIGIGSPDAALHILGNFKLNGILNMQGWNDPTTNEPRVVLTNPNGDFEIATTGNIYQLLHASDCFTDDQQQTISVWANGTSSGVNAMFTGTTCPTVVGIGTHEPMYDLHVVGSSYGHRLIAGELISVLANSASVSTSSALVIEDEADVDNPLLEINNKGSFKLNYFGEGNPFTIKSGNTTDDLFRINSNGSIDMYYTGATDGTLILNVHGIDNDEGIFALTSDGKVWCQGLEVMHAPFWGDYVFEKTYQLRPLKEVEQFVQANKHLPEFPSAEELDANGVDVYEMLRLLTVKVEELTLYTIELEKRIEESNK